MLPATMAVAEHARCVGDPPRQTEDPLSPPCVPFFDGDNGGATWPGVSGNAIDVVLYNDLGVDGPLDGGVITGDADLVRTIETYLRSFSSRYQSYEREVRLEAVASPRGVGATTVERQLDARRVGDKGPFAVVYLGDGDPSAFLEALDPAIVRLGLLRHMPRSLEPTDAWTFLPDRSTIAEISSSFICRSLQGRPARFATDPLLQGKTRSFALLSPLGLDLSLSQMALGLSQELAQRCGVRLVHLKYSSDATASTALAVLAAREADATTLICYCDADAMMDAHLAARAIGFAPEWFIDDATGIPPLAARTPSTFGVTSTWRGAPVPEQIPSIIYEHEDQEQEPDAQWYATVYYTLLNLFVGLQAAGPHLTPVSFEWGMFTFSQMSLYDPFIPTGGYGTYPQARSPRSWLDTGMAWWWDPAGLEEPGQGLGCWRLANRGSRRYPDGWPTGDGSLFRSEAPCTVPVL